MGARVVWALSNFTVFACMAGTAVISLMSVSDYKNGIEYIMDGNKTTRTAAVIVFALLGFPLAVCVFLFKLSFSSFFSCSKVSLKYVINHIFSSLMQITYSVPFSVTAEVTADSGGGQGLWKDSYLHYIHSFVLKSYIWGIPNGLISSLLGLAIGVLNLAIVVPQAISQI